VWDIFNASKDSVALSNRTNCPVLSTVDQLMTLCDELEARPGWCRRRPRAGN